MHVRPRASILLLLVITLLCTACSLGGPIATATPTPAPPSTTPTNVFTPIPTTSSFYQCPPGLSGSVECYTPYALRVAYGVQSLTARGFTGKGQTLVDIVSYGSPSLQQDMDVFDSQFGLPALHIQVLAPLGTVPFDPQNSDMVGWAGETELDVQIMHAIAPAAKIIVMTSPVDETEGTVGMPEFLQLEQYAVSHHLGQVFSQSYVASEATLSDSVGQQLVKQYTDFYQQITTQDGWTVISGSGDNGATDWANIAATQLATTATVNFPADVPWVTSVGGTTLQSTATGYNETAWSGSGGGVSKFFTEPGFQQGLPATVQALLKGQRGIPDIAADANPQTGMAFYFNGHWTLTGGTSASTPLWAALVAIANQMAGHPLGFINPGLYKVALSAHGQSDFRDIVNGNNSVQGTVQVQGFSAQVGWDAVTGWGAPLADHFLPDLITALG